MFGDPHAQVAAPGHSIEGRFQAFVQVFLADGFDHAFPDQFAVQSPPVQAVEVKHVDLPEQMIRAIARQAEAERERRAKVIHAAGEAQAAEKLTAAAKELATQPASITLRYLQTLTEIGTEKNTTVVFPLPIDFFRGLAGWAAKQGEVNDNTENKP